MIVMVGSAMAAGDLVSSERVISFFIPTACKDNNEALQVTSKRPGKE
jgi:hypothetical protein